MTVTASETLFLLKPEPAVRAGSALDVALELRMGVPATSVDLVREQTGLTLADVLTVVPVSNSTLKRVRQRSENLSAEVADALFRLLHVFREAAAVLGSREKALTWLTTPSRALNHHRPLDLLASSVGARVVEDELAALEHGFFA